MREEIHKMKMTILDEELDAQRAFWKEKRKLLAKESEDKLKAGKLVTDSEFRSIDMLFDVKVQLAKDRIRSIEDDEERNEERDELFQETQQEWNEELQLRENELHALRLETFRREFEEEAGDQEEEEGNTNALFRSSDENFQPTPERARKRAMN